MIKSKQLISLISRPAPDTLERSALMRLDRNERTTLFSEEEFRKIMSSITAYDLVAYAWLEPTYDAFVKWLNIKRENILLTCGSDAGIKAVFETFIDRDDEIINFDPNYAMYSVYAKMFGAHEIVKNFNEDLSINVDDLIASINKKTKMVVISNPGHNGTTTSETDILRVLAAAEKYNTIVLVDEAYYHYSDVTLIKHINNIKNLIVVRTLSKAFGLASVRVGYLLANPAIIAEIYRVKLVHEIDGISAKIARYMVEDTRIMENYIVAVRQAKTILAERFKKMGITLLPSESNFVYFKLNRSIDPHKLIEELQKKKIYIKGPGTTPPFNKYLRITLGDTEQIKVFCNELEMILNKLLIKT